MSKEKQLKIDFDCESLKFKASDKCESLKFGSSNDSDFLPDIIKKCTPPSLPSVSSSTSSLVEMPITESPLPPLKETPKFLHLQNFLTTLSALLISIYCLIISYNIYYLFCVIPTVKNFEAAEKLSSDAIGIIAVIVLCLILQIAFIYGIQKSKEWLLLFNSIFAFIITIICFMVTAMWMDKNLFNGPYDIYFWLTYFTMVPFCFLQLASGIFSMNFFTKLIYENSAKNTIRIINQPDYHEV